MIITTVILTFSSKTSSYLYATLAVKVRSPWPLQRMQLRQALGFVRHPVRTQNNSVNGV